MEMLIKDPSLEVFLCIKSKEREPNIPLKPMYVMSHSENPGALIDEAIVRGQDNLPGTFTYGHNIQKEYQEDIFDTQNKPHSGETGVYLIANREKSFEDDQDEEKEEEEPEATPQRNQLKSVSDENDFYLGVEPRPPRTQDVDMDRLSKFGDTIDPTLQTAVEEQLRNEKEQKKAKKTKEKLPPTPYESIKGKNRIPRPNRGFLFNRDLEVGNLDQARKDIDKITKTTEIGQARKRGKPRLLFKMKDGAKSVITVFDNRPNPKLVDESEKLVFYNNPIENTFDENVSSYYY